MIQLTDVSVGEDEAEANISDNIECDKLPCLFRNYRELFNRFIKWFEPDPDSRKYGIEFSTYYLVFKPFNKTYNKDFNAIDYIRKYITKKVGNDVVNMLIAREINETKVHYNVILKTINPISLHNVNTTKYKIHQQLCVEEFTHISNLLAYVIKEAKTRRMINFLDYYYK